MKEHEKLNERRDEYEAIADFIDWAYKRQIIRIAEPVMRKSVAAYFGIDLEVFDEETRKSGGFQLFPSAYAAGNGLTLSEPIAGTVEEVEEPEEGGTPGVLVGRNVGRLGDEGGEGMNSTERIFNVRIINGKLCGTIGGKDYHIGDVLRTGFDGADGYQEDVTTLEFFPGVYDDFSGEDYMIVVKVGSIEDLRRWGSAGVN